METGELKGEHPLVARKFIFTERSPVRVIGSPLGHPGSRRIVAATAYTQMPLAMSARLPAASRAKRWRGQH